MKRILYTLIVLSTVLFTGCREDQLEGEIPGKEVTLIFSSRSADLSTDALTKEIDTLHLLIFNENGSFSQRRKYPDLSNVSVLLPLGTYTFAYLSNIDEKQIGGLEGEASSLNDVIVSLQTDANGDIVLPGSIFSGTDKITISKDATNVINKTLNRMVGRLDINVSGLKGRVELQSVTLSGSPRSVNFDGTPKDKKASLKVPMSKNEALMKGQAIAFPTCPDSLARLEFVIVKDGTTKTYVSTLSNKVEANKIHTINAKVNVVGDIFDVTIEMSLEEWGATESEDIIATQKVYIDNLKVKIITEANSLNMDQVNSIYMNFTETGSNTTFTIRGNKGSYYNNGIDINGDTLILGSNDRVACGNYTMDNIEIQDTANNRLYVLPAPVSNLVIDTTCCVIITLPPQMPNVATADKTAILELRDAMKTAGVNVSPSWQTDNINLWNGVKLNTGGRIIETDYSDWDDYDRNRVAKTVAEGEGLNPVEIARDPMITK